MIEVLKLTTIDNTSFVQPKWLHQWLKKHVLAPDYSFCGNRGGRKYTFRVNDTEYHDAYINYQTVLNNTQIEINFHVGVIFRLHVVYPTNMGMSLNDSRFIRSRLTLLNDTTEDYVEHLFMLSELLKE